MASIQCKNCKCGIHYHGEPSGIEYVLIDCHDWEEIITAKFDPKNKVIDPQTGYPKLFRTDTIEEDFPDAIKKFWKCQDCGSLIFFDERGRVTTVYSPENDDMLDVAAIGITAFYFDDYQWDEITEAGIPVEQLTEQITRYNKFCVCNQTLVLLDAKNAVIQQYKIML